MLQFEVAGHIGADARVVDENGRKYVAFNVAHSERWTDQNGVQHDKVTWVSCILNGDGGNVMPYLRKGQLVYCIGRGSARVFSSEKERKMVAGLNLSVDRLELLGAAPDPVPRQLFTEDGVMLRTEKYWRVRDEDLRNAGYNLETQAMLKDSYGLFYEMVKGAWVQRKKEPEQEASAEISTNSEQNG